jgi:hypothetical protein
MSEQQIRAELKDLSDYLEGDLGHAAHVAIELVEERYRHRWCETPRHRGQQRTSVEYWVLTKYNYGAPLLLAMCGECHALMYKAAGVPVDSWRLPDRDP